MIVKDSVGASWTDLSNLLFLVFNQRVSLGTVYLLKIQLRYVHSFPDWGWCRVISIWLIFLQVMLLPCEIASDILLDLDYSPFKKIIFAVFRHTRLVIYRTVLFLCAAFRLCLFLWIFLLIRWIPSWLYRFEFWLTLCRAFNVCTGVWTKFLILFWQLLWATFCYLPWCLWRLEFFERVFNLGVPLSGTEITATWIAFRRRKFVSENVDNRSVLSKQLAVSFTETVSLWRSLP